MTYSIVDIEKSVETFGRLLTEFNVVGVALGVLMGSLGVETAKAVSDGVVHPLVNALTRGRTPVFNLNAVASTSFTMFSAILIIYLLLNFTPLKFTKPVTYVRVVSDSASVKQQ
jgi:large-conductance mechanosensitive channel